MNEDIVLPIKKLRPDDGVPLPQYMSHGASGMDVCASIADDIIIDPMERKLIPTGIAISVPEGYEAQIRPRSGLAIKHGITLLNTPGTIDSDYRGEINIIVINLGSEPFRITKGMRIAQMVIMPFTKVTPTVVESLDETMRGAGGFGHTGLFHNKH